MIPLSFCDPPERALIMQKKGFTLVEIMVVVAIIAVLAAIAIPNLLRSRLTANDAAARSNLKALSTASETFASINIGNYPQDMTSLTNLNPPYIPFDFCGSTVGGFTYACTFGIAGYTFTATPATIGVSGTTTFTISTGGLLVP